MLVPFVPLDEFQTSSSTCDVTRYQVHSWHGAGKAKGINHVRWGTANEDTQPQLWTVERDTPLMVTNLLELESEPE